MWCNKIVNVPADRKAAELPALVTWCCGKIVAFGTCASPEIGPQVTPPFSRRPFSLHPLVFRSKDLVTRVALDRGDAQTQFLRFYHASHHQRQAVGRNVCDLDQLAALRRLGTDFQGSVWMKPTIEPLNRRMERFLTRLSLDILIVPDFSNLLLGQKGFQDRQRRQSGKVFRGRQGFHLRVLQHCFFIIDCGADPQIHCQSDFEDSRHHCLRSLVPMKLLTKLHSKAKAALLKVVLQFLQITAHGDKDRNIVSRAAHVRSSTPINPAINAHFVPS